MSKISSEIDLTDLANSNTQEIWNSVFNKEEYQQPQRQGTLFQPNKRSRSNLNPGNVNNTNKDYLPPPEPVKRNALGKYLAPTESYYCTFCM